MTRYLPSTGSGLKHELANIIPVSSADRTQRSPNLLVVGLGDLLNLDGVVDNQVHELVKALGTELERVSIETELVTNPNLALDANGELLIKPDADGGMLQSVSTMSNPDQSSQCAAGLRGHDQAIPSISVTGHMSHRVHRNIQLGSTTIPGEQCTAQQMYSMAVRMNPTQVTIDSKYAA